jgi:hypothetical protein
MKAFKAGIGIMLTVGALLGAASAPAAQFHASAGVGVSLKGSQATSHKFTITGSSVTCASVNFTGFSSAATSFTMHLHPEYSGCTAFGFIGATFNTAGCDFEFDSGFGIDLRGCTAGGMIITASSAFGKCVVEIPNTLIWNGTSYATGGSSPNRDITITMNATNIGVRVATSTGICPLTVGSHTNGSYQGTTTLKSSSGELFYL